MALGKSFQGEGSLNEQRTKFLSSGDYLWNTYHVLVTGLGSGDTIKEKNRCSSSLG